MAEDAPTNVAIACQGGGTHTAFTAGALAEFIPALAARDARLVGLSGTSGGAISALVAWSGLLAEGAGGVGERLRELWADVAADGPLEAWTNALVVGTTSAEVAGAPVPSVSPYQNPASRVGQRRLRRLVERHVDFAAIPDRLDEASPRLVVGAVDINAGTFETFENEEITPEAVLASAALPTLFPAVELGGDHFWDGLFSQNPPVGDLLSVDPERKPDELWIVQISPQTREGEPTTLPAIADRRNELSGNLSLNQELRFVEHVNDWVEAGYLPEEEYRTTEVRRLVFGRELRYASKLDRDEEFIAELFRAGERRARGFLADAPV